MKLKYFFWLYLLMGIAVPYPELMAAGPGTEAWKNWIYMFGHAGWLHYTLNGIGWLMMWKIATVRRTLTAYALSVCAAYWLPHSEQLLGWSTVICYYLGLCFAYMPKQQRYRLVAVMVIGLFIPHIAASLHLIMLASGWLIRKLEIAWEKTELH